MDLVENLNIHMFPSLSPPWLLSSRLGFGPLGQLCQGLRQTHHHSDTGLCLQRHPTRPTSGQHGKGGIKGQLDRLSLAGQGRGRQAYYRLNHARDKEKSEEGAMRLACLGFGFGAE